MSEFETANAKVLAKSRVIAHALDEDNNVVDNTQLPHMPSGSKVVIEHKIYEELKYLEQLTGAKKAECSFLLFGYSKGQTVVFNDIISMAPSGSSVVASFNKRQEEKLTDFCKNAKRDENKIVAHGHTHPHLPYDQSGWYLNFSYGDIKAYINMREQSLIKDRVDFCGCLIVGGNFNFVFFDGNDTYRFDNVFVVGKDGILEKLPCFGPDVGNMPRGRDRGRQ